MKPSVTSQLGFCPLAFLNNRINSNHTNEHWEFFFFFNENQRSFFRQLLEKRQLQKRCYNSQKNIQRLITEIFKLKGKFHEFKRSSYDFRNRWCLKTENVRTLAYGTEFLNTFLRNYGKRPLIVLNTCIRCGI